MTGLIRGLGLLLGLTALLLIGLRAAPETETTPVRASAARPGACLPDWQLVASPVLTGGLASVGAVSPNEVWAFGSGATPLACGWAWREVPTPTLPHPSYMYALAARAPDDLWATAYGSGALHLLHSQGSAWTRVSSPYTGTNVMLLGLAALAEDDVWAVGKAHDAIGNGEDTLITHWDGRSWRIVPSPSPNSDTLFLRSVAAVTAADIWAVGEYVDLTLGFQTLILHWDGQTWQIVPSPNVAGRNNYLSGVTVVAADDAWAVGSISGQPLNEPLILHWDGQAWQVVPAPPSVTPPSRLLAISAHSASDIWAVGEANDPTFVLHWDGSTWQQVPCPPPPNLPWAFLEGVAARAADDVWAVGYGGDNGYNPAVALHWDGAAWTAVAPPDPPPGDQHIFQNVAALADGTVWAVGIARRTGAWGILIEHYSDPCGGATATPSPGPSNTPTVPPTATVPLTATPTATACTIQFTDVDQSNPFYAYIRCLACRGIVSGYSDGTFRWGNEATRGQLAKIIANAAGLAAPIPSTQQTFEDVPSSNAFWLFVERLAATGAIAGYGCGGPGEPCVPPGNRPYFRWTANATRGQIAKIYTLAAQIPDPIPTTQQTFADVPPSNPFWLWIEQLAGRGVISGYGCGGAGEPCQPPGNRPYFRWTANATRGQIAKIAAQTFFPGCQTPARP